MFCECNFGSQYCGQSGSFVSCTYSVTYSTIATIFVKYNYYVLYNAVMCGVAARGCGDPSFWTDDLRHVIGTLLAVTGCYQMYLFDFTTERALHKVRTTIAVLNYYLPCDVASSRILNSDKILTFRMARTIVKPSFSRSVHYSHVSVRPVTFLRTTATTDTV